MKKRLLLPILPLVFLLTNCQQKSEEKTTSTSNTPMVGNDLDKHGCKGSAGYTWSMVKNDCIQVFNVGVRLDPQDSTLGQTISAFAVFANDEKENEFDVEVFLPALPDSSIILKPVKDNGAGTWKNDIYTLSQWKGMYTLEEGKTTIYQGHR
jgi:hypothetical protein